MKHLQFCFLLFMFGYLGLLTQGMLVCSDFPSGKSELRVEFHKKTQKTNKKNKQTKKPKDFQLRTHYDLFRNAPTCNFGGQTACYKIRKYPATSKTHVMNFEVTP